jgi:ligand-binding sensor domain-containing protein/signal transduction histidine kinase/CheY-like chemotaxis protein
MNNRAFHFFLLTIILQVCQSNAQIQLPSTVVLPGLKVDNWQMDQGLPVNSIISVAQTADGWLFFGTEEGLVRFDGRNFLVMNRSTIPDLKVNFISVLLGSRDTSLWIGTEGDGLFWYKNNTFIKYSTANGLSDDQVFTLCEDSTGGLWIGTSGSGLDYLKNGKFTWFDTGNGLPNNYIRSIAIDARGRVWVGTQKGLSVIENGKIKSYYTKDGLSDDFIETLAIDKDQNLWIGTKGGGLNIFRQDKFTVYTMNDGLTSNAVTTLCFDVSGMLWIGTNGGGITRMMDGEFYPFTTKDGLSGDLIVSLFEDREGNIWAGSSGTGIDRVKKKTIQTLSVKEGLSGDVILPVFEDHSGVIWLGVAGKGINRLENGEVKTFTQKDGLPGHLVLTICEDQDNTLWIGTAGGGLTNYKKKKFTTYTSANGLSNNVVVAVYCDKSGTLWAGTIGGGINRFKNGIFTAYTTRDGLSDDNISCILEDRNGNLWVGTNDGLNKISDNKITVINQDSGLSDDYILSLYEDKQGNLWVGTASNGFNLIRDGKITRFTTRDGLINEVVLNILEDDFGYFWISCNKGIYKVKKQDLLDFADSKLSSLTTVSYGKADGMETIECNGGVFPAGCKTRDGKLLFPTIKGVAIIDPKTMKTVSSYFAPIIMEEFLVDGQLVKITSHLSIPSYSKRLEFRYAALNYTNPEKIKYRCMLAGFDKDWIECGNQRSIYYTNIPGGNYTFKVMAANESGQWDEQGYTEFMFHLKPPFYRSFLFFLIVVIFFSLLLFFVIYSFMKRFQRDRLKLLVDERTRELSQEMIAQKQSQEELQRMNARLLIAKEEAESGNRMRTAFMNNISHEIRTPLNGILGFSSLITQPDFTSEERELFHSHIEASSERLLNTITNYIDISLVASGNIEVNNEPFALHLFFENLHGQYQPLCMAKNIGLRLETPRGTDNIIFYSDTKVLKKIFSHLLDNAVKFTEKGKISFGCGKKPGFLEFFVKDTGTGISQDAQQRIFEGFIQEELLNSRGYEGSGLGLTIAQGLVKLLGGEIRVKSSKGAGCLFSFKLPNHEIEQEIEMPEATEAAASIIDRPVILVAEDDEPNYLYLEMILKKAHLTLLWAKDGQQAVDHCRHHPEISLVLMDLKMPGMDGFQATREIKSFRKALPVIAITAFAMSGDEKRALEAGCNDYIVKPVNTKVLKNKLKKYGVITETLKP